MKDLNSLIADFLNAVAREDMDMPVALILTPKAYKRSLAETGCADPTVKAFEFMGPTGRVVIQAGTVIRDGKPDQGDPD